MALQRTLEMSFATELNRAHNIRVYDVREDITASEISTAMDNIISKNIFGSTGGNLTGKIGARVVTKDTEEFELAQACYLTGGQDILPAFNLTDKRKGVIKKVEELLNIIGNVGFPIAVAAYLLIRIEAKLGELSNSITQLREAIITLPSREY